MLKKLGFALATSAAFVLALEGAFRLTGLPTGRYAFLFEAHDTLYLPDHTEIVSWGPIRYRLQTNAFGMRGPPVSLVKPRGVMRIAALGDSVTDGFFADEGSTYPSVLQALLDERGVAAEVLNAARAGGSIDKEARILRQIAPLDLDLVVLTFVTNDISDIVDTPLVELLSSQASVVGHPLERFLFGRTALGELSFSLQLRRRGATPEATASPVVEELADARYAIEGGTDYEANARLFLERYAETDGVVLVEPWSEEVEAAVERYLVVLGTVQELCEQLGAELVFAWFPSYPELYLPGTPDRLRRRLEAWAAAHDLRFLDLGPAFRAHPRDEPLHLAPLDFHPTPAGYRLLAESVADYLLDEGLLPPS